jgi:uncharacterized protein (TIGR03435 family)
MFGPRYFKAAACVAAFSVVAFAQQFEVASIRANKTDNSGVAGQRISIEAAPGRLTMRNVTLISALRWAYDVHDFQIIGGPEWRNSERYDIVARSATAASDDELRRMLRALLAERFKLSVDVESKPAPAYVMTIGRNGHRLRPSSAGGERGMRPVDRGLAFESTSMSDLRQFLSVLLSMDRPVVDNTGLDGRFDFTLTLFDSPLQGDPAAAKGALAGASESTYADALERIGLRLESKQVPIETVTIRRAEKPSEN